MTTKKELAQDFLKLAAKGESREAFKLYVGQNFKHHNIYFKGDGDTLMTAMEEAAKKNPDKIFEVQRALEDGNLVAVHSRIQQNPSEWYAWIPAIIQDHATPFEWFGWEQSVNFYSWKADYVVHRID